MIILILSIILFLTFTVLGGFHFYWIFGGQWGLKSAIPSKNNVASTLAIPKFATLIVGSALVLFGFIYLKKSGLVTFPLSNWLTYYGCWFIPYIFILRAIGEFNYIGFFKK